MMFSVLSHSVIDTRNVWIYELTTPLGDIYVVDWQKPDETVERRLFDGEKSKAEKLYTSIVTKIANGRM